MCLKLMKGFEHCEILLDVANHTNIYKNSQNLKIVSHNGNVTKFNKMSRISLNPPLIFGNQPHTCYIAWIFTSIALATQRLREPAHHLISLTTLSGLKLYCAVPALGARPSFHLCHIPTAPTSPTCLRFFEKMAANADFII